MTIAVVKYPVLLLLATATPIESINRFLFIQGVSFLNYRLTLGPAAT